MWTRSIPPAELALWRENGRRQFRVRMRRRGEVTWTNLSDVMGGDWVLGIRADIPTPDQVVAGFDVRLIRKAMDGATPRTVSPGISADPINRVGSEFRPFVRAGREIEVDARTGDGAAWHPWRLWLKGEVESTEWPGDEVLARCNTLDGVLLATQIEEEEERGRPDPGVPLAEEIQSLIDRWWDGPDRPTLRVIGNPELGVGEYRAAVGSLGELIRSLAQRRGWDVRYLWSEADQTYRLTLYLPPRDKTTPDYLLPVDEVFDVPGLSESRRWVRNAIRVPYVTEPGGQEQAVTVIDQDSIDEFRRQAMVVPLSEGNETPGTESQATALGNYALHDLSRPLIEARYRTRFNPFLELHDLLAIQADGARFDQDRLFGVVGGSHEVTADDSWTDLELSGGRITGQYFAWHLFEGLLAGELPADLFRILSVAKVEDAAGERTYRVTMGPRVEEAHVYAVTFGTPEPPDDWEAQLYDVGGFLDIVGTSGGTFAVPLPSEGQSLAWGVLPMATVRGALEVCGDGWEDTILGGVAPVTFRVEAPENAAGTEATLTVYIEEDPRGVVATVRMWEQRKGVESGPFDLVRTGDVFERTFALLEKPHVVIVRGELLRSDGHPPIPFGPLTADSDKQANVINVQVTQGDDDMADIRAIFDTDTAVGPGNAEYQIGSDPPVALEVSPERTAEWQVEQDPEASIEGTVRARNDAGGWGPPFPFTVPRPVQTGFPLLVQVVGLNAYRGAEGDCGVVPMNHRLEVTIERLSGAAGHHLEAEVSIGGEPFQPASLVGGIDPNNDTFDVYVNYPEFEDAGADLEAPVMSFQYQMRVVRTATGKTHTPVTSNTISRRVSACEP